MILDVSAIHGGCCFTCQAWWPEARFDRELGVGVGLVFVPHACSSPEVYRNLEIWVFQEVFAADIDG